MSAKDSLILDDSLGDTYRISWYLYDEDDLGACLGDSALEDYNPDNFESFDDKENAMVNKVASESKGVEKDDRGFYWESATLAKQALAACKIALKAFRSNKPWPEWAVKAASEGWKPPKNWKP